MVFCQIHCNQNIAKAVDFDTDRSALSVPPRCMRLSSQFRNEEMRNVRKKLRMNTFMHSEFNPDITYSSLAPIFDRVFKAKGNEYDEDTEKGNKYIMDYILDDLSDREMKQLVKEINKNRSVFVAFYIYLSRLLT